VIVIRKKCMVPMLLMVKVLEKTSIFGNIWRMILMKLAVDLSLSNKAHVQVLQ